MAYAFKTTTVTLDEAIEAFDHSPSDRVCSDLLRTAAEYNRDEMIGDEEFHRIVERVAEWLAA